MRSSCVKTSWSVPSGRRSAADGPDFRRPRYLLQVLLLLLVLVLLKVGLEGQTLGSALERASFFTTQSYTSNWEFCPEALADMFRFVGFCGTLESWICNPSLLLIFLLLLLLIVILLSLSISLLWFYKPDGRRIFCIGVSWMKVLRVQYRRSVHDYQ